MDPLWKWPGGKRKLAPRIIAALGTRWTRYHEPFVGAGAVALALPAGTPMILSDLDPAVVRLWRATADPAMPGRLAAAASGIWDRERYVALREVEADTARPDVDRAIALWLSLQLGFNGLYRRGRYDRLNMAWNGVALASLLADDRWEAARLRLSTAVLRHASAMQRLEEARERDAIYLDPPYVGTQSYGSAARWELNDLMLLIAAAEDAAARGARVVLSHEDRPEVRAMLDLWHVEAVQVSRRISCDGSRRGSVGEIVASIGGAS